MICSLMKNIEKYGGASPMCSEDIKKKSRATCKEKYGVEHTGQCKHGVTIFDRYPLLKEVLPNGQWLCRCPHPETCNKCEEKEFVIDAACFPGSSGSPVFLYNNGSYRDKVNHGIVLGSRLYFLGILYGGPSSLIRSKIATGGVTSNSKSVELTTNIPNNLGYVIKAEIMNDFIPLVETQTHSKIKKI